MMYLTTPVIRKQRKKKNLRRSQFSKKRGGVRRGMIMLTDSMVFFFYPFPYHFGALKNTETDRHINTMTWPGLGAGSSENQFIIEEIVMA